MFIKSTTVSSTSNLHGGGLYLDIYANTHANTVSNVLFTQNSVTREAGGLRIYESELGLDYSVKFCFFSGNSVTYDGKDVHRYNVTFNSFMHCFTESSGQNRLYVLPPANETPFSSHPVTQPNWLPQDVP